MDSATSLRIEHPPQTLREIVVAKLRNAIINGHFASGERLVERTLCEQLGVSRSIVREAIRYLEAEGLIEIAARNGPMVARLDWNQARQIYDIRLLLEAKAAADCAARADHADKAALADALRRLETAAAGPHPQELYDASTGFYEVIFRAAGHDIAWEIVQRLNGRISRMRALTLASSDRHVSGLVRMARIAMAILANDPAAAEQAVHDHLNEAAGIARTLLGGEPPAAPDR